MAKFNALIIGSGQIGAFFDDPKSQDVLTHAHAYLKHKDFTLLGFVDKDLKKANQAAKIWGTRAYASADEAFLSEKKIDVVSLCLPDMLHYSALKEIAKRDVKLVFAEKPLTLNLKEAKEIVDLYKKRNILLLVNYSRRFTPEITDLADKIRAGKFGDLVWGSALYGKGLLHNGTHMIDLIRLLVGEINAACQEGNICDFTEEDPTFSAELKMKDSGKIHLTAVDSRLYSIFELDLIFTKGRVRLTDSANSIEYYRSSKSNKFKGYQFLEKQKTITTSLSKSMLEAVDNVSRVLVQRAELACSGKQACLDMQIAYKIKNSKCRN